MTTAPSLSYDPPAQEIAYYEKLFTIADPNHVGQIQGRDAVSFLARSTLPMETLKGFWVRVDTHPTTNTLDKRKFFTIVRLIQLAQNGKTALGPTLVVAPEGTLLHPPYFEGIAVETHVMNPPTPASAPQPHPHPSTATTTTTAVSMPVPGPASSSSSNTLALTDPYMMQPGDQSKYETLFPQYEQDGFVYGQAAVTLFSKSGLDNEILRDIWNMVDNPVDNRLSKLEFAIAMHLIVCISKKNLPMPTTLPPSLEALKKAESMKHHQQPPLQQQQPTHATAAVTTTPPHSNILSSSPQASTRSIGRMSIGEAFENLTPQPNPTYIPTIPLQGDNGVASQQIPAITDMGSSGLSQRHVMAPSDMGYSVAAPATTMTATMHPALSIARPTEGYTLPESTSASVVVPSSISSLGAKVKLNEAGYSTHVTSTSAEEVIQLRSILQTLQAENISLKAQVGQFSEEEKQVRSEITHTSAEIVTLLQELTGLRNRVAEARIQLLEATAELKVLTDKKGALKELISQEQTTLSSTHAAIDNVHNAFEGLQQNNIQETVVQQHPAPTLPPPVIAEHNFFDMDSFVQIQPLPPLPPAATQLSSTQPQLMEPSRKPIQTPSDFIVYPVPEIPEYHPGNLMGGTSLSTVNRMGAGSVDGLSIGGEYSITSAHSAPNYYWNPDEFHEDNHTPSTVAVPDDDHHSTSDAIGTTEKPHPKDSKKWGKFLRKSGKNSNKTAADI